MKTFRIAILTGDLTRPLNRVRIDSVESLHSFCLDYDPKIKCSVITEEYDSSGEQLPKKVYFGSIEDFLKRLNE